VWRGPVLRDILKACGVRPEAVEVWLGGADKLVLDATPPFRKSIPIERAMDPDTIVAISMNNAPPCSTERISGAFDRPRLGRHLLDEASHLDRGQHEAAGQFLDEECLPRSSRPVSG
jgi:Oxidoreductase molybdopterin binding domain